jgi:membrane protein required for colicin V production
MIWVDNAFAGLLAIYTLSGLIRGYNQEVFYLVVWVISIAIAWCFTNDFAIHLTTVFATLPTRLAASFVALTIITLMVGWLINLLLTDSSKSTGLTLIERLGGMILGLVHGLIVAFVLVLIAGLTPLPKESWWNESQFVPTFQTIAVLLRDNIPTKLAASINYR